MKKITRYLAAAAAAVLAIVSCNKNEIGAPDGGNTRITIGARPAEAQESTKTYLSEETIPGGTLYHAHWSNSGEQLGAIFGAIDDKSKPITLTAEETTDNNPIFTANATLEDGTYSLLLFYPRSAYEKCYTSGSVGINLKAVQHPVLGSFDPACDIMGWSTDNAVVANGSYTLEGITLTRPMAILRVNLNAPTGGGKATEDGIGSVTGFKMEVAAGESASDKVTLTGRVAVSPTEGLGDWTVENSYVEANISASELITIGDTDGFQSIYLIVNPTTIPAGREITFSVETEKYSGVNKITRTVTAPSGGMAFEAGKVNTINLTLRNKDFPGTVVDENYNGDWLITGVKNEVTYAALAFSTGNNLKATAALTFSADGSTITSETDLTDCIMTFTKVTSGEYAGMYTIQDANSKYLYASSSSGNQLKAKDEPDVNAYWTVTMEGEDYSIIASKSSNRNVMRFNPNGNNDAIVACYASATQNPVKLYPASMISGLVTDPVITFEGAEPMQGSSSLMVTKTVAASATSVEFPYTKNKYVTEPLRVSKYSFMGAWFVPDNGWEVSDNKVTVTLTPNTTQYTRDNQLIVLGQGFTDEKRMYLLIKQEAAQPAATIATILADNTITSSNAVSYEVDGVTVMAKQGKNYIIADATGVMLLYTSTTLTVGSQYRVSGDVKLYNGVHEFTNNPTVTASTGTAPAYGTPDEMTVSSLTAYTSAPVTKYAVVYATAQSSGYLCSDGTNTINVYDGTGTWSTFYNKDVKVTGYLIGYYSGKINMIATAIEDNTDPNKPTLSVEPDALFWSAGEYCPSFQRMVTVTVNPGATFSVNGSNSDWDLTIAGNAIIVYPRDANTSTTQDKVFTFDVVHNNDATLKKTITCTQSKISSGGGDSPKTLSFSFTSNPGQWPTSSNAGTYTYTLGDIGYQFILGSNVYIGSYNGYYLMLKYTTTLGLPGIQGYKLTKVVVGNSSGCSTATKVAVTTDTTGATTVSGGAAQTFSTTSSSYTYNLSNTGAGVIYYLYITNKNCQIISLDLTYDPV